MTTGTNKGKAGRKAASGRKPAPKTSAARRASPAVAASEAPAFSVITEIKIPTKIGGVCAKEESRYACSNVILRREEEAGRGLLLATDGRCAAVVPTDLEDHAGEDSRPKSVPAALSKPTSKGARDIQFGVGPTKTLFGVERVWVDQADSRFAPEAGGDSPLRFGDVLPHLTPEMVYVGLNVDLLGLLAAAVNSPEGPNCKTTVVLAFAPKPNGAVALSVIGDAGIGVLMSTGKGSYELDAPAYEAIRKRLVEAEKLVRSSTPGEPVPVSLVEQDEQDEQGQVTLADAIPEGDADPLGDAEGGSDDGDE